MCAPVCTLRALPLKFESCCVVRALILHFENYCAVRALPLQFKSCLCSRSHFTCALLAAGATSRAPCCTVRALPLQFESCCVVRALLLQFESYRAVRVLPLQFESCLCSWSHFTCALLAAGATSRAPSRRTPQGAPPSLAAGATRAPSRLTSPVFSGWSHTYVRPLGSLLPRLLRLETGRSTADVAFNSFQFEAQGPIASARHVSGQVKSTTSITRAAHETGREI